MRNQKSKLRLAHLDFNRKLNSKPNLFSSIFLFEHSFRCKNEILFFALFYKGKGLRILILPSEVPFFWSQRWAFLAKVTVFGPQKMALLVAKSKF